MFQCGSNGECNLDRPHGRPDWRSRPHSDAVDPARWQCALRLRTRGGRSGFAADRKLPPVETLIGRPHRLRAPGPATSFPLKNRDIARAIEAVGALAHGPATPPMSEIRFARTCYDHLAGVLAIALRDELVKQGALRQGKDEFALTPAGRQVFRTLDIDAGALHGLRRSFAYRCLDWTERRHHIGGAVGAALLAR